MGRVHAHERDPVLALYKSVSELGKQLRQIKNGHLALPVKGSQPQQDGDGAMWIDNDDHSIHYVVNGSEYKLTGTLVP